MVYKIMFGLENYNMTKIQYNLFISQSYLNVDNIDFILWRTCKKKVNSYLSVMYKEHVMVVKMRKQNISFMLFLNLVYQHILFYTKLTQKNTNKKVEKPVVDMPKTSKSWPVSCQESKLQYWGEPLQLPKTEPSTSRQLLQCYYHIKNSKTQSSVQGNQLRI